MIRVTIKVELVDSVEHKPVTLEAKPRLPHITSICKED